MSKTEPCYAWIKNALGVQCTLPWGHAGHHLHKSTKTTWPAFTQRCGHAWCGPRCTVEEAKVSDLMKKARLWAESGTRPSTLAAEFGVTKVEIVDAIAKALLPFVKRLEEKDER